MGNGEQETRDLDDLLEEFLALSRRGEAPSVEEFAAQHPGLTDEIRDLFPAALALEGLKVAGSTPADSVTKTPLPPLEQLGDFRIIREIGRGGMGVVYEAEQESLGRRVALKVLLNQAVYGTTHTDRFEREARLAASLHHTNIVTVYGVGAQDDIRYYVMELIDGVSLDHVIAHLAAPVASVEGSTEAVCTTLRGQSENERWGNVARIGLSLAEALQHAHDQGVLHCDIKPANVLVDQHGGAWIADFGLARALHADAMSQTGTTAGTLRYMAPERFQGEASTASDLYSLGLLLYELLSLEPAYPETDRAQLIHRITHDAVPPLRDSLPVLPRDLDTIVYKLTAHQPQYRYASGEALADDLRRYLEGRPIAARPLSWPARMWRWSCRNPAVGGLATSVVLLVLVALAATGIGLFKTQRALEREMHERIRAEANAGLALEALDRMFSRFSPATIGAASQTSINSAGDDELGLPDAPVLSLGAATLLQGLLPLYDRLASETGDERQVREKAAAAQKRIGDVQWQLGRVAEAERSFHHAAITYAALARDHREARHLFERARVQNRLGQLLKAASRTDEGQQAHRDALATFSSLSAEMRQSREVRLELARTHAFLGIVPKVKDPPRQDRAERKREDVRPRRNRDAMEHRQAAVAELRALLKEAPDDRECLLLLALCCREGLRGAHRGKGEKLRGGREEATEILAGLVASRPDDPRFRYELAQTYAMDDPRRRDRDRGEDGQAEDRLRRGLEQMDWLVRRHPYVSRYATGRARLCHKLSGVYRRSGRWSEAETHCRRAVDELAMLSEQSPDVSTYAVWLGAYANALADLLVRRGRGTEAQALLQENLIRLRAIPEEDRAHAVAAELSQRSETILGKSQQPERPVRRGPPRH